MNYLSLHSLATSAWLFWRRVFHRRAKSADAARTPEFEHRCADACAMVALSDEAGELVDRWCRLASQQMVELGFVPAAPQRHRYTVTDTRGQYVATSQDLRDPVSGQTLFVGVRLFLARQVSQFGAIEASLDLRTQGNMTQPCIELAKCPLMTTAPMPGALGREHLSEGLADYLAKSVRGTFKDGEERAFAHFRAAVDEALSP